MSGPPNPRFFPRWREDTKISSYPSFIAAHVRILLLDGSYEVLDVPKGMLRVLRKDVDIDTASDCQSGPFDLVLTDDIHPGLRGVDFVKAIRKEHPRQRIAFLTVENEIRQTLWRKFKIRSLRKPVDKEELDKWWRSVLGHRQWAPTSVSHVRQLRQKTETDIHSAIARLMQLSDSFHRVSVRLRDRRSGRDPLLIKDEYDVQYVFAALLETSSRTCVLKSGGQVTQARQRA
jgi:CheY-like chemotaxis protein